MTGPGMGRKVWEWVYAELNWFRIHLLAFTFIPIMYV